MLHADSPGLMTPCPAVLCHGVVQISDLPARELVPGDVVELHTGVAHSCDKKKDMRMQLILRFLMTSCPAFQAHGISIHASVAATYPCCDDGKALQ